MHHITLSGWRVGLLLLVFSIMHFNILAANVCMLDSLPGLYKEHFRPQFHYSPPFNWSNDPNGLVYHEGEYHLFYQHYPLKMEWGPMHWGHAVSQDLVHWEILPIALYPDSMGYIFSGSVVVDENNTSGFQTGKDKPMVAIFTYFVPETKLQTQAIAFSNDKGRSWTKYDSNPIINNPGISDFRDPKVRWHAPSNKWVMILACGDHVKFYSSPNLKEWEEVGAFGKGLKLVGTDWDCPDFFPLKINGVGEEKWVVAISSSGAPDGGRGTHYYIGSFDGRRFEPDDHRIRWLDNGLDQYAGITFNNTGFRAVFMGWLENWPAAQQQLPDYRWRGAMTLPIELGLKKINDSIQFLTKTPVSELRSLESLIYSTTNKSLKSGVLTKSFRNNKISSCVVRLRVNLNKAGIMKFSFKNENKQSFDVVYDRGGKQFRVTKQNAGSDAFRSDGRQTNSFTVPDDLSEVELEIYYDRSVVEVFYNGNKWMTADLVFPSKWFNQLSISTDSKTSVVEQLDVFSLKSTWK